MSIHQRGNNGTPPGYLHRPCPRKPNLKQKAAKAQKQSDHHRKVQITLKPEPWKVAADG